MQYRHQPIATGYGPFHVNQFRVWFRQTGETKKSAAALFATFRQDFVGHFNPKNLATVRRTTGEVFDAGQRASSTEEVLEFRYHMLPYNRGDRPNHNYGLQDLLVPDVHPDAVVVLGEWSSPGAKSFAVETLQRLPYGLRDYLGTFVDFFRGDKPYAAVEEAARAVDQNIVDELLSIPIPFRFGEWGLESFLPNRKHFLAGRRSWRIGQLRQQGGRLVRLDAEGQLEAGDIFYLETAAIERLSDRGYADPPALNALAPQIAEDTVAIWVRLLENYVGAGEFAVVADAIPGTWTAGDGVEVYGNVHVRRRDFAGASAMEGTPIFRSVVGLHPLLEQVWAARS